MLDETLWNHEFRTYQGKPDYLYQNMMMCRDKSWLAVSKGRLSRKELLCAALHDLLPGILVDAGGRYASIELRDWASHGLYEYRFAEGTNREKLKQMRQMLSTGQEVYVGTIHPLLPFSARYNPQISRETYQNPNHIFVILGIEDGRYVYFDTSSYRSPRFVAYPRNRELGWIETETVDAVLEQLLQLSYTQWHPERRERLKDYGRELLCGCAAEYENAAGQEIVEVPGTLHRGRKAMELLREHLTGTDLDLSAVSWEFDFIDQGDLLNWKLTDLATRRRLMAAYLREEGEADLAAQMDAAAEAWNRLSTFMLYRREKKMYGFHERYGALMDKIMAVEDKIYIFLQKWA